MRIPFAFGFVLGLAAYLMLPQHSFAQPASEQPMFGGVERSAAARAADRDMIANALKNGGTRAQNSDRAVQAGWGYVRRKDFGQAMQQFNRAWLLDPDNGDAFHGFAVVTNERDKNPLKAAFLFSTAAAKPRQSPALYLDYGRFLLGADRARDALVQLRKALTYPAMEPDARALLALALVESGNMADACYESERVADAAQAQIRDQARAIAKQAACTVR